MMSKSPVIINPEAKTFCVISVLILVQSIASILELVSKELNHMVAILHVYAGGLNFMK